ncbi:MAG: M1 family metallopeptidase [Vicinamibacteria bacterium]|nr:M1 family metallopeptidase [Vicinamibacteria bacterium]
MLLGLLLLASSGAALIAGSSAAPFDVVHYDAAIEPDLSLKTVSGHVRVDLVSRAEALDEVDLDIGVLVIDSVEQAGAALEFTQGDRRLHARLKTPAPRGARASIDVAYHGAPRFGLEFAPEKSQIYTIFSTSQWLPCLDAPVDKATLRLRLTLPKGLVVVAAGRHVLTRPLSGGRALHEWRQDRPAPSYTFGFAAGTFTEATERRGRTLLRFLSTEASTAQLRSIFADTRDMMAFFEERSGVRYGHESYTQALVAKTIGQELDGFSLMSEEYGRSLIADPRAIGLMAHELAHQWWGNRVTCRDWTHFWLNEGFATFMAAAYRERRFGREVYLGEVEAWRARYEKVKAAGGDRSLVFPDWNRPTSDDRALVYQKGALVLHELRERIGESAFWKGIRAYTRAHIDDSVVTLDFERAMQQASGRDLSGFFREWVYLESGV